MLNRFNAQITIGVLALLTCVLAVVLWRQGGAWHFSAIPTEAVIRTLLLGVGGIGFLALSRFFDQR